MISEKKRVMVVDDSKTMCILISQLFQEDPYFQVVEVAYNGQDALNKLVAADPDLIILDIEMPIMSGLEFLPHARLRSRAKIIILSSITVNDFDMTIKLKQLGANSVVNKSSGTISFDLNQKRGGEIRKLAYDLLGLAEFFSKH